jgi:hypothetical protein
LELSIQSHEQPVVLPISGIEPLESRFFVSQVDQGRQRRQQDEFHGELSDEPSFGPSPELGSNHLMSLHHGLRQLMQRILIHRTRIKHVAAGKLVDLYAARITHDRHLVYAEH